MAQWIQVVLYILGALASGALGSLITIVVLKEKMSSMERWRDEVKDKIVYKDACNECKGNWTGQVRELKQDMKEDIGRVEGKVDKILERLVK